MNKKAINIIIGLMTAALVGIGWMQVNWIFFALDLNEEEFNHRVLGAINKVADRLEWQEQYNTFNYNDNGFARSFYQQELVDDLEKGELTLQGFMKQMAFPDGKDITNQIWQTIILGEKDDCQCLNCKAERADKLSKLTKLKRGIDNISIASRIKLENLHTILKQELTDMGIKLEYNYGVYSNRKKCFVVANNQYLFEDDKTQPTMTGYKNLHNSKYRVNLFSNDLTPTPPGMLMVYFPNKSSYLWSSVMRTLLTSLLFTSIILFCFIYTIQVIYRQKKLSEMKNDFINNMTHEFKTPIATISLATDSITSPMILGSQDKVRRFTDIIRQENRRMNNQVEKVLQMALIDKKDYNLKHTSVDLHEVIGRAVENINLQVEKKEGTVVTNLEATNPIIHADLTHISNIVNNLLDNANKYSKEIPEISVSTRNVSNGVEVIISDKGIGMTKEAKKHIFDKFYRVHTGNLHDVKGFGLGLSYVKAMMDAHKGTISVKSELDKGSSFILQFPFKA